MNKRRFAICLAVVFILTGSVLLWYGYLGNLWPPFSSSDTAKQAPKPAPIETGAAGKNPHAGKELQQFRKASIPKDLSTTDEAEISENLPPPKPLPQVSAESTQLERKEAFGLKNSVDFIVRKDEPFEVSGKKWTIEEIQQHLHPGDKKEEVLRSIQEVEVGPSIRKPIIAGHDADTQSEGYYAVRVVLPGENLWNIHFSVIQEYLARRQILLASTSDEPSPDGKSSGIGRLLKFIEDVVYVYNLQQNKIETDLNLIHPHEIVVFFKISDLFAALDQLQPEDLQRLRYVSNYLKLESPGKTSDLLDRRVLRE